MLVGQGFSQYAPPEISQAVVTLDRVETVAEHTHSLAMQQGDHQTALIADAIEEIAHLEKELLVTENPLAESLSWCTQEVLEQGIQQLQQASGRPEVQELISETHQMLEQVPQSFQQSSGQSSHGPI